MSATSHSTLVWNPAPNARSQPIPPQAWEVHRQQLCEMHPAMTLETIISFMKVKHGFTASRHQYVLQFQKWGLSKYKSPSSRQPNSKFEEASRPIGQKVPSQSQIGSSPDLNKTLIQSNLGVQRQITKLSPENIIQWSEQDLDSTGLQKRARTSMDTCSIGPKRLRTEGTPDDKLGGFSGLHSEVSYRVDEHYQSQTTPSGLENTQDADPDHTMSSLNSISEHLSVLSLTSNKNPFLTARERTDMKSSGYRTPSLLSHKTCTSLYQSDGMIIDTPGRATDRRTPESINSPPLRPNRRFSALEISNYARSGGCADSFSRSNVKDMEAIADFFYCAQLLDDAFVIHLMLYKSLRRLGFANVQERLSAVLNVAKSTNGPTQHAIARNMVQELLEDPDITFGKYHPEIHFLHLFMASHYQKQLDTDLAKQHRDAALKCFDMVHDESVDWQRVTPFATICHAFFDSLLDPESEMSAARTVCEHYFLMDDKGVDLKRRGSKTIISLLKDLKSDISPWTLDSGVSLLKVLLDWCYHTCLGKTPNNFQDEKQDLEDFQLDSEDMSATALYCRFWAHWQKSRADVRRQNSSFRCWNERLESTMGLSASECLATCAQIIVDVSSLALDAGPSNPPPGLQELGKFGLERLAKMTDSALAWYFVTAYTSRNCDEDRRRFTLALRGDAQKQDYVRAFSDEYIYVQLPDFMLDETSLRATWKKPVVALTRLLFKVLLGTGPGPEPTRQTDAGSTHSGKTERHTEGPCNYCDPPLNPSPASSGTDLGSMRRIRENLAYVSSLTMDRISWGSMGGASNNLVTLDLETLLGSACRSMGSLSLFSGSIQHAVDELETASNHMRPRSLITASS